MAILPTRHPLKHGRTCLHEAAEYIDWADGSRWMLRWMLRSDGVVLHLQLRPVVNATVQEDERTAWWTPLSPKLPERERTAWWTPLSPKLPERERTAAGLRAVIVGFEAEPGEAGRNVNFA